MIPGILRPDIEQIADILGIIEGAIPDNLDLTPSQWAEAKRYLPAAYSAKPGRVSYKNSPYIREMVDNFAPSSPVRDVVVMKPARIGFTQMVLETLIGYHIDAFPKSMLYVSADKELTEKNMSSRIDAMLATTGAVDKIRPDTVKRRGNRTGDTMSRKEYPGGMLLALGAKNANKMRQFGVPILLCDEVDTFDDNLGGQGSVIELLKSRTDDFARTAKRLWGSTPLVHGRSNIERMYHMGDQRKYWMLCPHCGALMRFQFGGPDCKFGLKFEHDERYDVIPSSVHYLCENGCRIEEAQKYEMMLEENGARWIADVPERSASFRSYQISALYSNFMPWIEVARKFLACRGDKNLLQVFVNNVLGETWKEDVKTIEHKTVMKQGVAPYKPGMIPNKLAQEHGNGRIVVLTLAVDVNGKEDIAEGWLAVEVKGHCVNGQTYSIAKAELHGNTERGGACWAAVHDLITRQWKSDDEITYTVDCAAVDCGFKDYAVFDFLQRFYAEGYRNAVAVKGRGTQVKSDRALYVTTTAKGPIWWLDTVYYKNSLAGSCGLVWQQPKPQPHGWLNFPDDKNFGGLEDAEWQRALGIQVGAKGYDDDYFRLFGSEVPEIEKDPFDSKKGRIVGWRKKHSRAPNHFWDCMVYGLAARDIYLNLLLKEFTGVNKGDTQTVMLALAEHLEVHHAQF